MKKNIRDAATVLALQKEIYRSKKSRYYNRLHGLLLVKQGMSCKETAALFGSSVRSIQNWLFYFEKYGLDGIMEDERPGRPTRLTKLQKEQITQLLHNTPQEAGITTSDIWDGKTLSSYIEKTYCIKLGIRQCQRLLLSHTPPFFSFKNPQEQTLA